MNVFNNDDQNLNSNQNDINEVNSSKNEVEQLKESFLRLNADFDNYKKRILKEKSNWIIDSQSEILLGLLPIVDDFDRAFSGYKKGENKEVDNLMQGFELIHKLFNKFLEKYGIKKMESFSTFDPEYHEAIAQVESNGHKSGEIVSVVEMGYFIKDKVLRPAKVMVAK